MNDTPKTGADSPADRPSGPLPSDSIVAAGVQENSSPSWLTRYPWVIYVLPLAVFMLFTSLEPTPEKVNERGDQEAKAAAWQLSYEYYPLVYTLKLAATLVAIAVVWPGYRKFAWRITPWSVGVGAVGVVLWVGLARLGLEKRLLGALDLDSLDLGQRSAFNPLVELADKPAWAYGFLAIRFLGLAAVVPIIEEFFLRGFLMRFVVRQDWWNVPFGEVNRMAIAVGTLVPMLMHPGELLAAAVWFSLVTWLMVKTRSIWDCVVAHAVTNLLLGVYVVATGNWQLM